MPKSLFYPLLLLFPLFGFGQLNEEQESRVQELKTIIESDQDDSLRVKAIIEWDDMIYYFDSELDKKLNEQLVDLARKNTLIEDQSAERLLFFQNKLASGLTVLSILKKEAGELGEAIALQNEALDIYELTENASGQGNALHNLAVIYRLQDFFEEGMKYDKKALKVRLEGGDKRGEAASLFSIGNTFANHLQNWDSASFYHHKAFEIFKEQGNVRWMAMCYQSFASVAHSTNDLFVAEQYYDSSLVLVQNEGILIMESRALVGLGRIYLNTNRWKKAKLALEKSLKLAEDVGDMEAKIQSTLYLSAAYDSLGLEAKAYPVYRKYVMLRDSLLGAENTRAILDQEYAFNYAQKTLADSLELAKKKEIEDLQAAANIEDEHQRQLLLWIGVAILGLIIAIVYIAYRRKAKDNELIISQKREVELQRQILDVKNQEITDSITYAKRIQQAILPPKKLVDEYLNDSFIYYKPKDVVAGDFYWMEKIGDDVFFAAADCTGHGVPGAMVSVVCNGALNRAVREFKLTEPGLILDKAREIVISEFNKSEEEVKDGMDIALCKLSGNMISYAGAHNPLWIMRKGKLLETKADKQPIGQFDAAKPFTNHLIELQTDDVIYLFSDGYVDQFGGEKGKKFKAKALRELLHSLQQLPLKEQLAELDLNFEKWKGEFEQIDDVCIIGVKV
jgi:serine phosphatase RsbU (regulator of sigma subunit)